MANQRGLPAFDPRPISRVEGCIRLGKKMAEVLVRHATAGSPELKIAEEISLLAGELAGLADEDLERRSVALVDAVRALWSYRSDFPEAARPFPMFEPALYAVQYLDPDESSSRGHDASTTIGAQVDAALAVLIGASLLKAVRSALDTSAEWIFLARAAGLDDGFELAAIKRFAALTGLDSAGLQIGSTDEVARTTDKLQAIIELACHLKPEVM
jgi:hypothetical protein